MLVGNDVERERERSREKSEEPLVLKLKHAYMQEETHQNQVSHIL